MRGRSRPAWAPAPSAPDRPQWVREVVPWRSSLVGAALLLLLLPLLKHVGPVLDGVENGARHVDRALHLQREDDRVARAGVYLDNLRPELVLHGEEDAREEGLLPLVVD